MLNNRNGGDMNRINRIASRVVGKEERIDTINRILEEKTADKIDGVLVDVVTANMLKTVYSALKPPLQKKFNKIPIKKLVDFGWSVVK